MSHFQNKLESSSPSPLESEDSFFQSGGRHGPSIGHLQESSSHFDKGRAKSFPLRRLAWREDRSTSVEGERRRKEEEAKEEGVSSDRLEHFGKLARKGRSEKHFLLEAGMKHLDRRGVKEHPFQTKMF